MSCSTGASAGQSISFMLFSEILLSLYSEEKNNTNTWYLNIQDNETLSIGCADNMEVAGFVRLNGEPAHVELSDFSNDDGVIKPINIENKEPADHISLLLKSTIHKYVQIREMSDERTIISEVVEKLYLIDVKNNQMIWEEKIS